MCNCTPSEVCEDCSLQMEENYKSNCEIDLDSQRPVGIRPCIFPDSSCICEECLDFGDDSFRELDYKYADDMY